MSDSAVFSTPVPPRRNAWAALNARMHGLPVARVCLLIAAFAGAIAFNNYGSPDSWFSDELTWVAATMLNNKDLDPHFFAYPAGLQIYSSFFVYKLISVFNTYNLEPSTYALNGQQIGTSSQHLSAGVDMFLLNSITRTLSALFFVTGVSLFERSVALIGNRRQDLYTLIIFATSCAMIHHAHIGTAQASLFLAIGLVSYTVARCVVRRSPGSYYVTVLSCGIAIGTKYTGIYLAVCLLFLFFWSLKDFRIGNILITVINTFLIGFLGVVVFNPFIIIDYKAFINDVVMVAVREAPMFVSQSSGVEYHASMAYYYLSAFFGPLARLITLGVDLLVFCVSIVLILRRDTYKIDKLRAASVYVLIVGAFLVSYFYLEVSVNISQSRYYIPIGLSLALILCVGLNLISDVLSSLGTSWKVQAAKGAMQVSGLLIAASCVALGIAYVMVFPLSGHVEAFRVMKKMWKADPTARVTQLSLHTRSAVHFDKKACMDRCSTILNAYKDSDLDVSNMNSWNDYFQKLEGRLKSQNPTLVALEDIMLYWNYMIPKGNSDYSSRGEMQNPGPESFKSAFRDAGYSVKMIIPRIDPRVKRYNPVLNDAFDNAAEGVGGDIYIFERHPAP